MLAASALARAASRGLRRPLSLALPSRAACTPARPAHRRLHRCRALWTPPTSDSSSFSSASASPSASPPSPRAAGGQRWEERIISALVVNRPGTLAQLADVFAYADQNISSLCVRSTVVPELSRVTISCALRDRDLPGLKKRLRALVAVTFFHVTTRRFCVENRQLLLRSQLLLQLESPLAAASSAGHKLLPLRLRRRRWRQLRALLDEFGVEVVGARGDPKILPPLTNCSRMTDGGAADPADQADEDKQADAADPAAEDEQPLLLHLADDPERIERFLAALRRARFRVLELQQCGPLFLDTSHSTYDPQSAASFTREVGADVERLLLAPVEDAGEADASGRSASASKTAAILREMNKHAGPAGHHHDRRGGDADDEVDADLFTRVPAASTFQLHSDARGYLTTERLRLHARIAHQLYESAPQGIAFPKFVLLIGIPGAGKSTILSHLDMVGQLSLADFVNFDVDDIIALLPEFYHAMLNVGLGNEAGGLGDGSDAGAHRKRPLLPGPQTRYQLCRDEARFILKKNLHSAIMCRKNIILHGSGKSFASYAGVIDQVKSAGFDAHVVCLDVPVDVAYARVHKRSNNGYGRDVPPDVIDAAARLVARNFRRLASRVPNAHLFDSVGLPPRLVWSKQRAQVVASDPDDELQRKFQL